MYKKIIATIKSAICQRAFRVHRVRKLAKFGVCFDNHILYRKYVIENKPFNMISILNKHWLTY